MDFSQPRDVSADRSRSPSHSGSDAGSAQHSHAVQQQESSSRGPYPAEPRETAQPQYSSSRGSYAGVPRETAQPQAGAAYYTPDSGRSWGAPPASTGGRDGGATAEPPTFGVWYVPSGRSAASSSRSRTVSSYYEPAPTMAATAAAQQTAEPPMDFSQPRDVSAFGHGGDRSRTPRSDRVPSGRSGGGDYIEADVAGTWDLPPQPDDNTCWNFTPPRMPAPSDASSVWSAPFEQVPTKRGDRGDGDRALCRTGSSQAERNLELGIPQLPLATIASSSFNSVQNSTLPKVMQQQSQEPNPFCNALTMLTQAIFRRADALDTSRSGASSAVSQGSQAFMRKWAANHQPPLQNQQPPPQPAPMQDEARSTLSHGQQEADISYRGPQTPEADSSYSGPQPRGGARTPSSQGVSYRSGAEQSGYAGYPGPPSYDYQEDPMDSRSVSRADAYPAYAGSERSDEGTGYPPYGRSECSDEGSSSAAPGPGGYIPEQFQYNRGFVPSSSRSATSSSVASGWHFSSGPPRQGPFSASGGASLSGAASRADSEAWPPPRGFEGSLRPALSDASSSQARPNREEIDNMASRIAASRNMSSGEEDMVRRMLTDLADQLFYGSSDPSAFRIHEIGLQGPQSGLRRPGSEELQQIAKAVGGGRGDGQVAATHALLTLMTDALFGGEAGSSSSGAASRGCLPANVPRPSPRTLETIAQRVIARSGSDREGRVREMLAGLTEAVFGPTVDSQVPVFARPDEAGSQPPTARSSVRSKSTTSEDVKEELNQEVRGLLSELCGVLFTTSP